MDLNHADAGQNHTRHFPQFSRCGGITASSDLHPPTWLFAATVFYQVSSGRPARRAEQEV
jgi:hypothetical protein